MHKLHIHLAGLVFLAVHQLQLGLLFKISCHFGLSISRQCLFVLVRNVSLLSLCRANSSIKRDALKRALYVTRTSRTIWKDQQFRRGNRMRKISAAFFVVFAAIATSVQVAKAEEINCGLKTITVQNGKIDQIRHEDGTIHSGSSVSDNWG